MICEPLDDPLRSLMVLIRDNGVEEEEDGDGDEEGNVFELERTGECNGDCFRVLALSKSSSIDVDEIAVGWD